MRVVPVVLILAALSTAREPETRSMPTWAPHASWADTPLPPVVQRGLKWLVSVQGRGGGYGQDGGHDTDVRRDVKLESEGNDVANTSLVGLALIRAGNTPTSGPYRGQLLLATRYILEHVERAPDKGLAITAQKNTQVQRKLGGNVDTFLATMLLSQVDGKIPDAELNHRVHRALRRCVAKIEKHQNDDGSWSEQAGGWAPVMSQAFASRGLAMARDRGIDVKPSVFLRARRNAETAFDPKTGRYVGRSGTAGVQLYDVAQVLEEVTRPGAADRSRTTTVIIRSAVDKLTDQRFVGGFGSMGGEEFMSYLSISDSLARGGGREWLAWDDKMLKHLGSIQNADGTWAGHHCITGRVACTSAALLTLMAQRTRPKSAAQ